MNNKMIDENILQFRLDATRDSQKMSRLAFLVSTILSMGIIMVTLNAYFSWYTGFALIDKMPPNPVTDYVHKEVIEQWVESANISLPFLGIKVGVGDCSVFGSLGLLIINVWFFLSIRREYYVINSLLNCTLKPDKWDAKSRRWIYHGIASHMLFVKIGQMGKGNIQSRRGFRPQSMLEAAFLFFVFFPPISLFILIFADILTIFILPAPFRFPHIPLIQQGLVLGDIVKLFIMEGLACIFLGLLVVLCNKSLSYVVRTAEKLNDYAINYRSELTNKN